MLSNIEIATGTATRNGEAGAYYALCGHPYRGSVWVPYGHYFNTVTGEVCGKAPQEEIDQAEVKAKLGAGPEEVGCPYVTMSSIIGSLKEIYVPYVSSIASTSKLIPLSSLVSKPVLGTSIPHPPETHEPEEA